MCLHWLKALICPLYKFRGTHFWIITVLFYWLGCCAFVHLQKFGNIWMPLGTVWGSRLGSDISLCPSPASCSPFTHTCLSFGTLQTPVLANLSQHNLPCLPVVHIRKPNRSELQRLFWLFHPPLSCFNPSPSMFCPLHHHLPQFSCLLHFLPLPLILFFLFPKTLCALWWNSSQRLGHRLHIFVLHWFFFPFFVFSVNIVTHWKTITAIKMNKKVQNKTGL